MKKRIALLVAVTMVAVLLLSMGTAMAATKTVTLNYVDYYSGAVVTDYLLATSVTLDDQPDTEHVRNPWSISYSEISSYKYNIHGVASGSPSYITLTDSNTVMTIRVTAKSDVNPTPTYYYDAYGSYGGRVLTLGYGDYVYESIELANPLAYIAPGTTLALTAAHLGGLSPTNTHLTFSTSNSAVATTLGPIILGNYAGTCKLNVYYNGSLIIIKDIVVTGTSYYNGGSIVTADDDLRIGPASFNAKKGRSYKFTNIRLDGVSISPTKLRWESSNTKIATVSKSGVVRTRKVGSVVITAETTDGENSASIDFIVS